MPTGWCATLGSGGEHPLEQTRKAILRHLLHHREGLSVEQLAARLGISRSGVQQHVALLEREGLVQVSKRRRRLGRPLRLFRLSEAGYETFPRRYDLISTRTLQAIREMAGEEALDRLFESVAQQLAAELLPRVASAPAGRRLEAVLQLMNELGYEASGLHEGNGIRAVNCIYHQLARETRAVCRFDVRLLSRLADAEVLHEACMADGAPACLFRLRPHAPGAAGTGRGAVRPSDGSGGPAAGREQGGQSAGSPGSPRSAQWP